MIGFLHAMTTDAFWVAVVQYSIPALMAVLAVWLPLRNTNKKVEVVRELAEPTGNGFAKRIESALDDIQKSMTALNAKTDLTNEHLFKHLESHLNQGSTAQDNPGSSN